MSLIDANDDGTAISPFFERTLLADGTRYRLPRRPLGALRFVGLFVCVFGLLFVTFPVGIAVGAAITTMNQGTFSWISVVFIVFTIPFMLAGAAIVRIGLFVLAGHTTIEIRRDRIVTCERAFGVRRTKRRPFSALRRLQVMGSDETTGPPYDTDASVGRYAHLRALRGEFEGDDTLFLAVGYPRDWLLELAQTIQIEAGLGDGAMTDATPAVTIEEVTEEDRETPSRPVSQPINSDMTIDRHKDGVTITIPPTGFKGAKGLFGFSVIWCGFMAVFTTFTVIVPLTGGGSLNGVGVFAAFCAAFWAIGIGMFVAALNMAKRHAIVDILGQTLMINRKSLFGFRQHEWTGDDIVTIRVGKSGMEVNDVPVLALVISTHGQPNVVLFSSRTDDELRWLVWEIRAALRISNDADDDPTAT